MSKLILQEFFSIDGFCADGDKTTGFFDGTYHSLGKDVDAHQGEFVKEIDLILLGAHTYKMFANYWPQASTADSEVTEAMNRIPKMVFSNSLQEVPWGHYGNSAVVSEDAVAYIKSLKATGDKNMVVWGSISLAQSLLKANLFDEIQIIVVPVVLGKGYKLFPEADKFLPLRVTGYKHFAEGETLHIYKPG